MADFPPTIIVVHPREKRRKCTVEPLRTQAGFVFWKFPNRGPEPLDGYMRLGFEGPCLSEDDADRGLLVLDGTWRLAEVMVPLFEHLPTRSLPLWKTAYPRVSQLFDDPTGGLATIEALYAAYTLMGRQTNSLLDNYHWADEFLLQNGQKLA